MTKLRTLITVVLSLMLLPVFGSLPPMDTTYFYPWGDNGWMNPLNLTGDTVIYVSKYKTSQFFHDYVIKYDTSIGDYPSPVNMIGRNYKIKGEPMKITDTKRIGKAVILKLLVIDSGDTLYFGMYPGAGHINGSLVRLHTLQNFESKLVSNEYYFRKNFVPRALCESPRNTKTFRNRGSCQFVHEGKRFLCTQVYVDSTYFFSLVAELINGDNVIIAPLQDIDKWLLTKNQHRWLRIRYGKKKTTSILTATPELGHNKRLIERSIDMRYVRITRYDNEYLLLYNERNLLGHGKEIYPGHFFSSKLDEHWHCVGSVTYDLWFYKNKVVGISDPIGRCMELKNYR